MCACVRTLLYPSLLALVLDKLLEFAFLAVGHAADVEVLAAAESTERGHVVEEGVLVYSS